MPSINGTLKDNMHLIRFGTLVVVLISFFIYLRADTDSLRVDTDSLKIKQEEISKSVQKIEIDVAVTGVKVENIEKVQETNGKLLESILKAVTDD